MRIARRLLMSSMCNACNSVGRSQIRRRHGDAAGALEDFVNAFVLDTGGAWRSVEEQVQCAFPGSCGGLASPQSYSSLQENSILCSRWQMSG